MMPTKQKCPKCGTWFMCSDAIGDPCPSCPENPTPFDINLLEMMNRAIEDEVSEK